MALKAGHCSACHTPVWRIAIAQRGSPGQGVVAGARFLLWPKPDSLYARVATPGGYAPGIAFCMACAPPVGAPWAGGETAPVLEYETARGRYTGWFEPGKREFFGAWLKDALGYTDLEVNDFLLQWDADRGQDIG